MQKHVNLADLVKSFTTNILLQNLASIQKRTSPANFAYLAENQRKVRYRTFQLRFLNIGLASLMILSFLFGTSIYQCTNVGPGTVVDYRGMRPSREDRPDGAGDSSRNPFQARTFSAFRDFSATQYQRFQDFHTQHFLLTDHDPPGE